MAIQSIQLICQYQGSHIYEKAYKKKVMDFITINHFISIKSEKMTGDSQTKTLEE